MSVQCEAKVAKVVSMPRKLIRTVYCHSHLTSCFGPSSEEAKREVPPHPGYRESRKSQAASRPTRQARVSS